MRDTGRLRTGSATILALAGLTLLGGCGHVSHGDMVIFATSTKVAFDVSAEPTNAGTPSVTLGYKRQEGVLMPLVVNGRESVMVSGNKVCDAEGKNCRIVPAENLGAYGRCLAAQSSQPEACLAALVKDVKYVGSDGTKTDTYSVFASFGGDFSGGASGAKAGLAQFFATGIAAQNLANKSEVTRALKAESTDTQVADAQKETIDAQKQALEAERAARMQTVINTARSTEDAAITCWNDHRADFRTNATGLKGKGWPAALTGNDDKKLREVIGNYPSDLDRLSEITKQTCPAS